MQIYPQDSDIRPTTAEPMSTTAASPESPEARGFRVVFNRDSHGPLWRVDVMADHAVAAAQSVAYSEQIPVEMVLGVIDLHTIR